MSALIVLHGRYRGYIQYERKDGRLTADMHGIPSDSVIYAVNEKSIPIPWDGSYSGRIYGIIVTDKNGNVIMEGRAAHTPGSNRNARFYLPQKAKRAASAEDDRSDALKEILKKRDELFSEQQESIPPRPEKPSQSFNPFYNLYPDSEWSKVMHRHDRAYHLRGKANIAGQTLDITAVPMHFYTERAFLADGFTKVAQADNGDMYRMRVRIITE